MHAKRHIGWIDSAKGIGILLVIAGHVEGFDHPAVRFIYLFHMPLFFFLSGYLHTIKPNLFAYFKRKLLRLMLPYAGFLVLLAPLYLSGNTHAASLAHLGWSQRLLDLLWGGNRIGGVLLAFWFVPCLFMPQQAMNALLVTCRGWIVAGMVLASLALSYVDYLFFRRVSFPLDANIVLAAMPFFYFGYLVKTGAFSLKGVTPFAWAGALAAILVIAVNPDATYEMRDADYGLPFVTLGLALCCLVCVISLCQLFRSLPQVERMLGAIGAASMGMMFLHQTVRHFLPGWLDAHRSLAFLVVSCVSYLFTRALSKSRATRLILLGSEADLPLRPGSREQTAA